MDADEQAMQKKFAALALMRRDCDGYSVHALRYHKMARRNSEKCTGSRKNFLSEGQ
jgi:hypothetical protein